MRRKASFEATPDVTIIAVGLNVAGHLKSTQPIWFDGNITGDITCELDIKIGPNGKVDGHLSASNIIVQGKITGDISCQSLFLHTGAIVRGNVKTKKLVVEDGAWLDGQVQMSQDKSDEVATKD